VGIGSRFTEWWKVSDVYLIPIHNNRCQVHRQVLAPIRSAEYSYTEQQMSVTSQSTHTGVYCEWNQRIKRDSCSDLSNSLHKLRKYFRQCSPG